MDYPRLSIRNLSRHFVVHIRDGLVVPGIADVSLDVRRGEFLGLVGRSGSGKSTLLKCIYRTYLPDSGSILYRGRDGATADLATADDHAILRLRRRMLGYVSQSLRVLPRVTVERTVARGGREMEEGEALARARGLLEALTLPEPLWGSFPSLLSGGEQQRVNIARALMGNPDVLLLDEPTSALDAENQDCVVDLLRERLGRGATIVGVFHDAPTLERLASRTVRMAAGRVLSQAAGDQPAALAAVGSTSWTG